MMGGKATNAAVAVAAVFLAVGCGPTAPPLPVAAAHVCDAGDRMASVKVVRSAIRSGLAKPILRDDRGFLHVGVELVMWEALTNHERDAMALSYDCAYAGERAHIPLIHFEGPDGAPVMTMSAADLERSRAQRLAR